MHLPVYTHPTPFSFAGDRRTPLWVKSARCGCGCGGDRAYRLPLDHRCARPAGAWSLSREHDVSETPHRTWLAPYDMVTIWGGRMASRARIDSSDSLPPTHRAGSNAAHLHAHLARRSPRGTQPYQPKTSQNQTSAHHDPRQRHACIPPRLNSSQTCHDIDSSSHETRQY